jgi:hypothetical protein
MKMSNPTISAGLIPRFALFLNVFVRADHPQPRRRIQRKRSTQ